MPVKPEDVLGNFNLDATFERIDNALKNPSHAVALHKDGLSIYLSDIEEVHQEKIAAAYRSIGWAVTFHPYESDYRDPIKAHLKFSFK